MFGTMTRPRAFSEFPAPIPAADAQRLISHKLAPEALRVKGHLDLSLDKTLAYFIPALPADLQVDSLDLSGRELPETLPAGIKTRRLNLSGCHTIRRLPPGLRCYELKLSASGITELPLDLQVTFRLDLSECHELERLPKGLKVGSLILRNCAALETLPEGLDVSFLDISGCAGLGAWPEQAHVRVGRLDARNCMQLTSLPDWLTDLAQLDLAGCKNLTELPAGLRVRSWIDLADTSITALPVGMENVQVRWRGVAISHRIAFQPETITAREIFETPNVELRRVLMERMGYEAFVAQANPQTLDADADPGGERHLLSVPIAGDEPLVVLMVSCPSTERRYMLRVPPSLRSCRQAAAWLAGFDREEDYQPLVET